MNKKRGFKRLPIGLLLVIGLFAFWGSVTLCCQSHLAGLIWGAGFLLIYFVLLVWFICWIVHWVVLGFADDKPKNDPNNK